MALNTASGFTLGSSDPIDDRLVLSKAQMKSANDNVYPDVYMCVCTDDGCIYTYNKTNEVDATTGKFRLFKSGDDSDFETKLKEFTQNNVEGNKGLPVSDTAIKNLMAAENGLATLDASGKLVASQLPTSAREIVGYMDASVDHTLPDETDYDNGNEIIITTSGYIIQSTAFTLEAGKTLTNLEVNQANQLIGYGYVFTLEGKGTVSSFATDKVTMLDGTEISLPYDSDLSATSTPATVQVPVKEGDSIMLIDGHWIHLSSTSGVESVNGKTGVVTVQEYDADNKEQLAKIGENAEGNLTYNGEEIKGGSDEFVGTKAEWEALSTEEKAKYHEKKVNFTDDTDKIIDDTTPATDKVYSSEKVEGDFAPIQDSANVSVDAKVYRADLNDVGIGYYRCTTECSNLPESSGGYVHTIIRGDGFKFQTYMSDSGLVYTRCKKVVAKWESWNQLVTRNDGMASQLGYAKYGRFGVSDGSAFFTFTPLDQTNVDYYILDFWITGTLKNKITLSKVKNNVRTQLFEN